MNNLQSIHKDEQWLKNELSQRGYHVIEEIYFVSMDHVGHFFIDLKDKKMGSSPGMNVYDYEKVKKDLRKNMMKERTNPRNTF